MHKSAKVSIQVRMPNGVSVGHSSSQTIYIESKAATPEEAIAKLKAFVMNIQEAADE